MGFRVLVQILDEGEQTEPIGPSVQEAKAAAQISDGVCPTAGLGITD